MTDNLKSLEKKVSDNTNIEQSAVMLVNGMADALDGLTQDPVAIKAMAAELRSNATAMGKAVCANTDKHEAVAAHTPSNAPKVEVKTYPHGKS